MKFVELGKHHKEAAQIFVAIRAKDIGRHIYNNLYNEFIFLFEIFVKDIVGATRYFIRKIVED